MLVNFKNEKVKVWFNYRFFDGKRITDCEISTLSDQLTIGQGSSYQKATDPDVKFVARKYALKRALSNLPREERQMIWNGYLSQINIPKRQR